MRGKEFSDLTAFAAVASNKSFARAAAQLRVTPSMLSQTIRQLEERVGVRLLNRTTRSVGTTEAGARLFARLGPALRELDRAVLEIEDYRDKPVGVVRINTAHTAIPLLAQLLPKFYSAYPDIVLDVAANTALVDIADAGFDIGIRLAERLEKDMIAVKFGGRRETFVVASPRYLRAHGTPKSPADLRNHRCINVRFRSDGSLARWEFERRKKAISIAVEGPLIVDSWPLLMRAAIEGVGIAYMIDDEVIPHIERRKLVRILEPWSPRFDGFFVYYPSRRKLPGAVRAFVDFVRENT